VPEDQEECGWKCDGWGVCSAICGVIIPSALIPLLGCVGNGEHLLDTVCNIMRQGTFEPVSRGTLYIEHDLLVIMAAHSDSVSLMSDEQHTVGPWHAFTPYTGYTATPL
jgi:hypothetical protein